MQPPQTRRYYVAAWAAVCLLGFYVVVTSAFGESPDWENYNEMFDSYRIGGVSADIEDRIEPGFKFLFSVLQSASTSNVVIFGLMVVFSLAIKCFAINSFSNSRASFVLTIAFYLVVFAPLHELTQLRAALAISIIYLSFLLLLRGRLSLSLSTVALASTFHISAVLVIPFFLLINFESKGRIRLTRARAIFLAFLVYVVVSASIKVFLVVFEDLILIVSAYQQFGFGDEPANPLSASILLNLAMIAAGFFYWNNISKNMQYVLAAQVAGAAFFYASLDFQVVAYRVYELIQSFWVFYLVEGLESRFFHVRLIVLGSLSAFMLAYAYIYFLSGSFFQ